ncbi:MAG: VOC family protein [Acidobacteriota bacterium]
MTNKLLVLACTLAPLAFAQVPAPNAAGVSMGHLHIKSRDVAAQRKLWIDVLGGRPGKLGPMESAKFPGVIVLYQQGEPDGGTVGSVVNHLGFCVRDLQDVLAKARAAGIRIEGETKTNAFIMGPDEIKIELMADPKLAGPAAHHHVHFFDTAVDDTKAWYVKTFGAAPGRRAQFEAADVPGANLTFTLSPAGATVGTKGRALDHIGFEVKNLEAFTKKLEAAGVKFDVPYKNVPALGIAVAFLTDPFGTYVELTEGLDKL